MSTVLVIALIELIPLVTYFPINDPNVQPINAIIIASIKVGIVSETYPDTEPNESVNEFNISL